jgi:AraC-like DNA-binding protein
MNPNQLPPSLDTWTSFFLLAAGQGFFLSTILLFHKQGNLRANKLLAVFVFLFALTLVDYVGFWTRYSQLLPPLLRAGYEYFVFLFGPLLFFYLKAIWGRENGKRSWLHFLPAMGYPVLRLFKWWQFFPNSDSFFFTQATMFVGHLSYYGYLSWGEWKRSEQGNERNEAFEIRSKWSQMLLVLYAGFILSWIVYYILLKTPWFSLFYDYSISLAMTALIYAVGYLGFRQPKIFTGEALTTVFRTSKYQNSSLTPSAASSIRNKLVAHMKEKQPYLENELRLTTLATEMGVSTHHLSQVINEQFDMSFSDFINGYRVEAAKEMLISPKFADTYIIDVAYAAGFNNKTTFNKIFKQATGLSPSEYRAQHLTDRVNGIPQAANEPSRP